MTTCTAIAILIDLICRVGQPSGSGLPEGLTVEAMRADFRQLVAAVKSEWSYFEDRVDREDVDFDLLLSEALDAIDDVDGSDASSARTKFARILRRFVAGLHDGHAGLFVPGESHPGRRLPFDVIETDAGIIVTAVDGVATGTEEAGGAPRVGDRWVSQGGRDAAALAAEAEAFAFGSTAGARRRNALESILLTDLPTVECAFETMDGGMRTSSLATLPAYERRAVALQPELRFPREDVALVAIETFAVADWQAWLAAKPEERDGFLAATKETWNERFREIATRSPRALILDLRGNGGGTDLLGIHVAQHLLDGPFRYFLLSSLREGTDGSARSWSEPHGMTHETAPEMTPWRGKVIALIDEKCFSTTDNLLRCLDDLHPDFTTVGRPTNGGTGAPREIATLEHSGAKVTLCTMRVHGPKGELIEGRGTVPDVPIRWTRDDVVNGRDPDLEAALARIEAQSSGR